MKKFKKYCFMFFSVLFVFTFAMLSNSVTAQVASNVWKPNDRQHKTKTFYLYGLGEDTNK